MIERATGSNHFSPNKPFIEQDHDRVHKRPLKSPLRLFHAQGKQIGASETIPYPLDVGSYGRLGNLHFCGNLFDRHASAQKS